MAGGRVDTAGVIVACTTCGRANRLKFASLDRSSRCGQCKSPVLPPSAPIEVPDSASFDAAAANSTLPLIVDFWAPWCGPCRMVAPELERVARDEAGRFLVIKVNTDVVTDIAERFRIRSIPTLAIVYKGTEINRAAGARGAAEIVSFARESMAAHQRRAS